MEKKESSSKVVIPSFCSSHPLVIEAAFLYFLHKKESVLIEATSNQVNQFGGYTGMRPIDFKHFVYKIAESVNFPKERIMLGGDHLGPNCWTSDTADIAMEKSTALIQEYVKAGFTKIHLDASMSCYGDPIGLSTDEIARRSALLCQAAESAVTDEQRSSLRYVIGSEVPVPGGESHSINEIDVTKVSDVQYTIQSHYNAFAALDLHDAIKRIIAIVVQPGVEFDHSNVIFYQPEKTEQLTQFIETTPLVYEAHSTDYQTRNGLKALVDHHFSILKVGPALTFALREAYFALCHIEDKLVAAPQRSYLFDCIMDQMLDNPKYWDKYYHPPFSQQWINLSFSLSDRCRYYWTNAQIEKAVSKLIENLDQFDIPLSLLSQYLPKQYEKVRECGLIPTAKLLIIDKIQEVIDDYYYACFSVR